jgi:hypothetical protein
MVYALCVGASVLVAPACTHSGERVVVPSGASDAGPNTPDLADADRKPIGPIARPVQTNPDYRLIRSPELGLPETTLGSGGSSDNGGRAGIGGSNNRPVCTGGSAG